MNARAQRQGKRPSAGAVQLARLMIKLRPEYVRAGVPSSYVDTLAGLGLDRTRIMRAVGAESTLRRKLSAKAPLSPDESDRLARLARIVAHALDVFGSDEKAVHWLERASRAYPNGEAPLNMLDTDAGARWVDERLSQIDYGMFA